jgi:membrane carboxypeptidase/penicillin-binding protein PbpC
LFRPRVGCTSTPSVDFWGFVPNENVLPPARKENAGSSLGLGGAGISWSGLCPARMMLESSGKASVEEGNVEEELSRAEDDEVSLYPYVEAEFACEPPLPL